MIAKQCNRSWCHHTRLQAIIISFSGIIDCSHSVVNYTDNFSSLSTYYIVNPQLVNFQVVNPVDQYFTRHYSVVWEFSTFPSITDFHQESFSIMLTWRRNPLVHNFAGHALFKWGGMLGHWIRVMHMQLFSLFASCILVVLKLLHTVVISLKKHTISNSLYGKNTKWNRYDGMFI